MSEGENSKAQQFKLSSHCCAQSAIVSTSWSPTCPVPGISPGVRIYPAGHSSAIFQRAYKDY